MAFITRTQVVHYDSVTLLAVKGKGTDQFDKGGRPERDRAGFGAVFSGAVRITRLANGNGFNILSLDASRGSDRKRVHFQADAVVNVDGEFTTMRDYWHVLGAVESVFGADAVRTTVLS